MANLGGNIEDLLRFMLAGESTGGPTPKTKRLEAADEVESAEEFLRMQFIEDFLEGLFSSARPRRRNNGGEGS